MKLPDNSPWQEVKKHISTNTFAARFALLGPFFQLLRRPERLSFSHPSSKALASIEGALPSFLLAGLICRLSPANSNR